MRQWMFWVGGYLVATCSTLLVFAIVANLFMNRQLSNLEQMVVLGVAAALGAFWLYLMRGRIQRAVEGSGASGKW